MSNRKVKKKKRKRKLFTLELKLHHHLHISVKSLLNVDILLVASRSYYILSFCIDHTSWERACKLVCTQRTATAIFSFILLAPSYALNIYIYTQHFSQNDVHVASFMQVCLKFEFLQGGRGKCRCKRPHPKHGAERVFCGASETLLQLKPVRGTAGPPFFSVSFCLTYLHDTSPAG